MDISSINVVYGKDVLARMNGPMTRPEEWESVTQCFVVELPQRGCPERNLAIITHVHAYVDRQKFYVELGQTWKVRRNDKPDWSTECYQFSASVFRSEIVSGHSLLMKCNVYDGTLPRHITALQRIILAGVNDAIDVLGITDMGSIGDITLHVLDLE